ncbi:hypothetical protein E9993_08330 [Labilibacter sediminis]|nr:hypothetical protein E9993_08330 [Labilibacter sediminis]
MKKLIVPISVMMILTMSFTLDLNTVFMDAVKKFKLNYHTRYAEKLYLHLDRPLYFSGDDMWFQSYLINASNQLPNSYEKVLYVELINPNGVISSKRMFKLFNGKCEGNFKLGADLKTGRYQLVAYTNWMRNQGSDFFFKKEIRILSGEDSEKYTDDIKQKNHDPDTGEIDSEESGTNYAEQKLSLTFLPEGGNLLEGVQTKVAFAGVNQSGQPMNYMGKIVDQDNQLVTFIRSMYNGKGFFYINPQSGKSYKAKIQDSNNETIEIPLPQAQKEGYSLSINNKWNNDSIDILVQSRGIPQSSQIVLFAQQDGSAKEVVEGRLSGESLLFRFAKDLFKTGIAQLTLFNEQMVAQCERLVFINHHDQLKIRVEGSKEEYLPREKVELELFVEDKEGNPVQGEFSLSVTDANLVKDNLYPNSNLLSYIYFDSNLPGVIKNSEYLLQNNAAAHSSLDLNMMVNGWRRFKWEEVLQDTMPKLKYALEQGIFVEGKLSKRSGKKSAKGIEVTMAVNGSGFDVYSSKTDENGNFVFNVKEFNDTVNVIVQTRNKLNSKADYSIALESNLRFEATDFNARRRMHQDNMMPVSSYSSEALKENEVRVVKGKMRENYARIAEEGFFQDTTDILIDDIEITAKKKRNTQQEMVEQFGSASIVLGQRQLEDLINDRPWYNGLVSLLYDAIPGLRVMEVSGQNNVSDLYLEAEVDSFSLDQDFTQVGNRRTVEFVFMNKGLHRFYIYVDGELIGITNNNGVLTNMNQTLSFDDFIYMDPLAIKSIEVITSPRESPLFDMFSESMQDVEMSSSPEAILSIYTKTGGGVFSQSYNRGITNFRLFGYERKREFYAPQYDGTDDNKIVDDQRATIHWDPVVVTDETGKAKLAFYNTDIARKIRFEMEGFSNTGIPGSYIAIEGSDEALDSGHEGQSDLTVDSGSHYEQDFTEIPNSSNGLNVFHGKVQLADGSLNGLVDVSVENKSWGTVSNAQGSFMVNLDEVDNHDVLRISVPSIAYYKQLTVGQLKENNGIVVIRKHNNKEAEGDALKLVQQALKSLKNNTRTRPYYLRGAFAETILKGRDLYRVSDFSFIQQKQGYHATDYQHATMPLKGRVYKTEDYNRQIKNEPINILDDMVPNIDPLHMELSFLNTLFKKSYTYELTGMVSFQGRSMYRVRFNQKEDVKKHFYKGEMLIDKASGALAYVKWKPSEHGKKYELPQMYLKTGEEIDKFESLQENNEAIFHIVDDKWVLKSAIQQAELRINNTKMLFNRSLFISEVLKEKPKNFKSREIDDMKGRRMLIKTVNYLPEFWREGWFYPLLHNEQEQIKYLHEVTFYN